MTERIPPGKSADAYRTIGEVADDLKIPQHVLRFWETRFPQIKPLKRAGGRRFYHPEDVALLQAIKALLYGEGYTIKGVQRLLQDQGPKAVAAAWRATGGLVRSAPGDPGRMDGSLARHRETEDEVGEDGEGAMRDEEPPRFDDGPTSPAAPHKPPAAATPPARPPSPRPAAALSGDLARRLDAVAADLFECGRVLACARNIED